MASASLLGDGVVFLLPDSPDFNGGDEDVTSDSRAFRADEVMLARRCWKDPGGGRGSERGISARFACRLPGPGSPRDEKVVGEYRPAGPNWLICAAIPYRDIMALS